MFNFPGFSSLICLHRAFLPSTLFSLSVFLQGILESTKARDIPVVIDAVSVASHLQSVSTGSLRPALR